MLLVTFSSGAIAYTWYYWLPTLTSMLIWPWLFIVMRDLRRKYGVV